MNTTAALTLQDVTRLATILEWCQHNTHVRWLLPNGNVIGGTVRSVGYENGNFLRADDDVRGAFVRVTCDTGLERAMSVVGLVALLRRNEIAADR